tara:strand:+ start:271 stop:645 length:375 start_codon:yes stop_codon:yes gene_type:complete
MASRTLTALLALLLAGALLFIFIELPDHCNDSESTFHSHCHHLRDAGVNCRPGQDCWENSLGDSTPGTTGWVLIFGVGALVLLALFDGFGGGPTYVSGPRYYPPPRGYYNKPSKSTKLDTYPMA